MLLESRENTAGIHRIGSDAERSPMPGQSNRQQSIGCFGLSIGFPLVVGTVLIIKIVFPLRS